MADAEGKRWEWTDREERYLERLEQFGRTPGMHWLLERLRAALGEIERLNEVGRATVEEREDLRTENERLRDDATELTNAAIRDGNERARLCEEIERLRGEVEGAYRRGQRSMSDREEGF